MTRYTAHDYDAAWQVWDNVERRSVGGSFTEVGALAEAARLNAGMPARALSVDATMLVSPSGRLVNHPVGNYQLLLMAEVAERSPDELLAEGYRITRVRITEIEGGDSHG